MDNLKIHNQEPTEMDNLKIENQEPKSLDISMATE